MLIFKMAIVNARRRSKDIITNISIVSLTMILIICVFSLTECLNNYIDNALYNSTQFRTLYVNCFSQKAYDNAPNLLKQNENIIDVYPYLQSQDVEIIENNGEAVSREENKAVTLDAYNKNRIPEIVNGDSIAEGDANVALVPEKFYDRYVNPSLFNQDDNYIAGSSYIGKEITVEYVSVDYSTHEMLINNSFQYTFKIVGTYDSDKVGVPGNTVLVNYNDLNTINNTIVKDSVGLSEDFALPYLALVDKYDNVKDTVIALNDTGDYNAEPMSVLGKIGEVRLLIINITLVLVILLAIISSVNIALTTIKSVKERIKEIGLLKAVGYTNSNIQKQISMEMLIVSIISFSVTLVITTILYLVFSYIINKNPTAAVGFKLLIDAKSVIIAFVVGITIPFFSSKMSLRSISKIQPSVALKE